MAKNNQFLHPDRADFLDDLAENIIDSYFLDNQEIVPRIIADDYRITYNVDDYGNYFDGLLAYNNGKFHIFVNSHRKQSKNRLRFTFCHELGHFFIDGHRTALVCGHSPYASVHTGFASESLVEREADFFAACLLLPKKRVVKYYRTQRKFNLEVVSHLSETFKVSELSTLYRILHLDLHPIMIVMARDGRITSIQKSKDFYYYPKHGKASIPEDSSMYELIRSGSQSRRTEQNWTGDWFDCDKDDPLFEHCVNLPEVSICYSLLWQD